MQNNFINQLIVNDGWEAFAQGQTESECPYTEDPTAAEKWLYGHRKANEYFNWKRVVYSKWDKRSED